MNPRPGATPCIRKKYNRHALRYRAFQCRGLPPDRDSPVTVRGKSWNARLGLARRRAERHAAAVALDRKWLHAQFNLGFKLVVHYLKKLWPWSPRYGLERFQQNYVVDGLPPATLAFRKLAEEPGRCTTCGACDRACPILDTNRDFIGPMRFVVSGARAAPHLDDVKDTLRILTEPTCTDCKKCEAACPEAIPILAIAAGLKDAQAVVVAARAGTVPISAGEAHARARALEGQKQLQAKS